MIEIKKGIVFSEDIKRILNGVNAFDYKYDFVPSDSTIRTVREDFKKGVNEMFNGDVSIITEDEMMNVNSYICGDYPHCNIR